MDSKKGRGHVRPGSVFYPRFREDFFISKEIHMKQTTFVADGQTKIFRFTFPFFLKSDVIIEVDGQPATNYNLICTKNGLNADVPFCGGEVHFTKPPQTASVIKIQRKLLLKRIVDYQPTSPYSPTVHNQDMNYIIEILKDMQDALDSVVSLPTDASNKQSIAQITLQIIQIGVTINELRIAIENTGESVDLSEVYSRLSDLETEISTLNINISQLADQVQNINIPTLPNNADYVIESWLSDDGKSWYRKYQSGWVEQGGCTPTTINGNGSIPLLVQMSGNAKTYTASVNAWVGSVNSRIVQLLDTSTATTLKVITNSPVDVSWMVFGMAA